MKRKDVIGLVNNELCKTDVEKPKFHSNHEGYGALKEEFDELWDEIKASKEFRTANKLMVNEAVQVAAMAIKFIENLYRIEHENSNASLLLRDTKENSDNGKFYL